MQCCCLQCLTRSMHAFCSNSRSNGRVQQHQTQKAMLLKKHRMIKETHAPHEARMKQARAEHANANNMWPQRPFASVRVWPCWPYTGVHVHDTYPEKPSTTDQTISVTVRFPKLSRFSAFTNNSRPPVPTNTSACAHRPTPSHECVGTYVRRQ